VSAGVNVPALAAAARLTELGAAVTKVEPPGGDPTGAATPDLYGLLTSGQDVVRLDLKDASGRDELSGLLESADVLLTSSRPSALRRLGLGWSDLEARYPRLVQVAIVGYPEPEQERAGHDLTYLATHGLLSPPGLPLTLLADLGGAERAATAVAALLTARERDGGARYAEVALADSAKYFALPWTYGLTRPGGVLGGGLPFYGLYAARGGWVAVAALEPHFRERLVTELGVREATAAAFAACFRRRTPAEWERWAGEHDLPIAAVAGYATIAAG
jgi:crotonobetainyl-CoA:carnitine CoA-transferase CaiB-like acyl-CoA transferase